MKKAIIKNKEGRNEQMKMMIAIVHDHDAHILLDVLNKEGFKATKMASTGGFLREGNTTFIIGTDNQHVEQLLDIIKENCKSRKKTIAPMSPIANSLESYYSFPMQVQIGGATVFIIDVEQFLKI
ncbi:MAG: cyclic-di-AMP receptor [Halanaerobiales bacterium]|nr:cyclic-di-AMP receptor [Halanaerobiales bacterium]